MHKLERSMLLVVLSTAIVVTGCPDDDTNNDTDAATKGDGTTSDGPTTTMPTTAAATTTGNGTTSDETTAGDDLPMTNDATMTDDGSATDTGTTDDGAMTDTDTGMVDPDTGETGMMSGDGWGDCINQTSAVCTFNEFCLTPPGAGVCGVVGCTDASDCEAPPATGDAPPACVDALCLLDCSGGQTCPDGMICWESTACAWPLQAGSCPDEDLGSTVPQTFVGDNGLGEDHEPSCAPAGGGADALLQFTAPAAGTYQIDTVSGSMLEDTTIFVLDGCGGQEIACDDNLVEPPGTADVHVFSSIQVDLGAGDTIIIGVDTPNGGVDTYTLNISEYVPVSGGDCCNGASGVGGCETAEIEECVCMLDDYCCDMSWDATCVAVASSVCFAECG